MTDITFCEENARFRYKAAAVIIEEGALAFMTNPDEDYFYPLGGAVQLGETSEDAVLREIKEETGQDYEIDRLLFIHENFFQQNPGKLAGLNCHEISFYYLMKPKGQQFPSISPNETVEWIPLERIEEYQAYPNFLTKLVTTLPAGIKRVITKDEKHTFLSL
ncbi:NUDIX domain protein [Streptococcus constellatus]|uniref:NUDIX domain protein n=1 Tax=Streptococcus constellatus TaxID=76860 RepID=A0A564T268_STRCV|nr:NUDIX domain-containing protein [Streptococcus constellatus]VUW95581.1 NUDIX domain protein [Streptococcus gordonii]VUX00751.1 NUDIX domain protein [Streptococcus constellatus]